MKTKFLISHKIRPTFILFLLLLIAGKMTHAQSFTLQQVLDSIDANNTGLQQFALKTKASFAKGNAAKAWMAPTAGVGMSEFPYPGKVKTSNGLMPRKMLMLRLKQMFPNFSKQKKENAYYKSFASQNKDDRATLQNLLFAKAKLSYYDAYIAEKKLTVISQQEKQLQLLIKISEGRLTYNKASLPNIYKARAKLNDLQSMRIQISSKVEQATAIMNSLMHRAADAPLQIDTSVHILQQQAPILSVDSGYVQTHRSDIRHITDAIHSMTLKQQVASSNSKPIFGVTWDNMRMNSGRYMYNAMATISIPIAPWFSKGYKSKVRSMDFQIQAMQRRQNDQVQQALGNIRKDWLNLQAAHKDLHIFQDKVIPSYAQTYQANLNAFSENTGNIYETLMAWNDLTQKELEYYNKLADVLNIRVVLETELQEGIKN